MMLVMMFVMLLVIVVYFLFFIIYYKDIYMMECSSGYECGFNFMSNTRISFSYRFFLIGILFLIFDVEIVLLLSVPYAQMDMLLMMMFNLFIMILIMGLMYEYYCGSLEWVEFLISKA